MKILLIGTMTLSFAAAGLAQSGTCSGLSLGQGASLNGFIPFQGTNSLWNTDISAAAVDPNSANYISFIGGSTTLHPDFGAGEYNSQTIGIPYQVEANTQAKVKITLGAYASESDPGPMPVPSTALIEGYPKPGNGDRHVLVLQQSGCWLYELYNAHKLKSGGWSADSTAVWDMTVNEKRPFTWTSADAAGLPIFAGLARYDEVAAGAINHALRFTVPTTQQAFVAPASHWASSNTSTNAPPMGMRMRLKSTVSKCTSPATPQSAVIVAAMKKYGIILADNGSAIFVSGTPDNRWNNNDLNCLKTVAGSDFEVVQTGTVITPANVPVGPSPTVNSFTANPTTVASGQPVTLSWSTANSIYNIISPGIGPVRGASIVINPTATMTFTLYSTNQYGRTTKSVTVTVQ